MPRRGEKKIIWISFAMLPFPDEAVAFDRVPEVCKEQYEKIEKAVKKFNPAEYSIQQRYIFEEGFSANDIEWTAWMRWDNFLAKEMVEEITEVVGNTVSIDEHRKAVVFLKEAKAQELVAI